MAVSEKMPKPQRKKDPPKYRIDPKRPVQHPFVSSKRPRENTIISEPVMRSPLLKMTALEPLTPRSKKVFSAQLNQGAIRIDTLEIMNDNKGINNPKKPAIRMILTFKFFSPKKWFLLSLSSRDTFK